MLFIDRVLAYVFALAAITPQASTTTSAVNSGQANSTQRLLEKRKLEPLDVVTFAIPQMPGIPLQTQSTQQSLLTCGDKLCACECVPDLTDMSSHCICKSGALQTPAAMQGDIMDTPATITSDIAVTTAVNAHRVDEL